MLQQAGLETPPNPEFNPNRRPIVTPKDGWKGMKLDHEDPAKNVRDHLPCQLPSRIVSRPLITFAHRLIPAIAGDMQV